MGLLGMVPLALLVRRVCRGRWMDGKGGDRNSTRAVACGARVSKRRDASSIGTRPKTRAMHVPHAPAQAARGELDLQSCAHARRRASAPCGSLTM